MLPGKQVYHTEANSIFHFSHEIVCLGGVCIILIHFITLAKILP